MATTTDVPLKSIPGIGNNFALAEMQLILAKALQRFRLKLIPNHPIAFKPEVTLRPKYGMKMTLESV